MKSDLLIVIAKIFGIITIAAVIIYYLPSLFEVDEKPETEMDYKKEYFLFGHKIIIEKEKI